MTENPFPRPSFGRALGEAARKLGKLHRRALADFDADLPRWMLLTLLAEQDSAITLDDVAREMDRRMDLPRADVVSVLERAAAAGLVDYRPQEPVPAVVLTDAGSAHFAKLYAHARKVTDAAADGIDPVVLETVVTVLLTVDERATALLGA